MDIWGETKIDFLGKRRLMFAVSGILIIIGIIAAIAIPLGRANLGTDFSGGVSIQFKFDKPISMEAVRALMSNGGFKDANLQQFAQNDRLLVRLKKAQGDLRATSKAIGDVFTKGMTDNSFIVEATTEVGPTVGKKLQSDALWAVGLSLLAILIYVAVRFEFRFGVAAVVATFHDIIVVLGFLYVFDKEISLLIVTALLTLAGYSLTDTVVVFDRIRENMAKKTKEGFVPLVNRSINEVLRRTIVNSIATILAVLALLIFGGEVIYDFALALFVGIIVGTYSSIFIASPVLLLWKDKKAATSASVPVKA